MEAQGGEVTNQSHGASLGWYRPPLIDWDLNQPSELGYCSLSHVTVFICAFLASSKSGATCSSLALSKVDIS